MKLKWINKFQNKEFNIMNKEDQRNYKCVNRYFKNDFSIYNFLEK